MVFIVEDDKNIRYALSHIVKGRGVIHNAVETVEQAIYTILTCTPTIIILDFYLINRTASPILELCTHWFPKIEIVLISAMYPSELSKIVDQYNIKYYINKPFGFEELECVLDLIEKGRTRNLLNCF